MKRKGNQDDIGVFNVLLIGENPLSVSIADNIKEKFMNSPNESVKNVCNFNIVDDIEKEEPSKSWFNEFIFELTKVSRFNNIVISDRFRVWMTKASKVEILYMKLLLKAMNFVIVDVLDDPDTMLFDDDIPQYKFYTEKDFLTDLLEWIDSKYALLLPKMGNIRLIRSLAGNNLPYLGDVFGCLSGKKHTNIVRSDKMRFDVPILFDEFCSLTRGRTLEELETSIVTRTSSALSVFFK